MGSYPPHASPVTTSVFLCEYCAKARGVKYPHGRTKGNLTWPQLVKHWKYECPYRTVPKLSSSSSSLSPKQARRLYEKFKHSKKEKEKNKKKD